MGHGRSFPRPTWHVPTRKIIVRGLALVLAAVFAGIGLAQVRVETGVESFLPAQDPAVAGFEDLARSFGGDPVVVLLRSEDPRALLAGEHIEQVLGLEGALSRLPDVASVYGPATTLNRLAGQAQVLLAELTGRRDGLGARAEADALAAGASPADAAAAGAAAVTEFDVRYGSLIVEGLPTGLPTLRNAAFVEGIVYNGAGEPRPQWQYIVPDERSLAILVRPREGLGQGATERLADAVAAQVDGAVRSAAFPAGIPAEPTVSGVPRIVAALGGTIDREIPVIGAVAVVAIGLCLFAVPWTTRRRRLLPLAVTVAATAFTVAVLGWLDRPLSLGVVAFLPVLIGLGSFYPTYFARGARPRTVLVVALGTAAGFGCLALSPLPFVQDLGFTLAVGIGFAAGLGWLLLGRTAPPPATALAPVPAAWPRRRRIAAVAVAGVFAAAGWAALPVLDLQTNIDDLTAGLPAIAEADRVEQVLGSSGELAIVLRGDDVLDAAAWSWMVQAQQAVVTGYGDRADPVLSPPGLLAFLGAEPTSEQIRVGMELLPDYLTNAVVRSDARVAALTYGVALDDLAALRELVDDIRADLPAPPPGYEIEFTGLPMVAVAGFELVSGDRYLASLAGLLAAGAVLLVGLRHRSDGGRAIAAAALATGAELFLLWVTSTPLNPLTVALGSLTAAVGCEFTVMVAEAARRRDPELRVAVGLATLTAAAGFAVLALSQLAVMREFGILLALSVVLSWLAALFVVRVWPPTAEAPVRDNPPVPALVGVV